MIKVAICDDDLKFTGEIETLVIYNLFINWNKVFFGLQK